MTLSRRDTLRIAAAGVAARGIAPFAVSPEDARALLAGTVTVDDFPQHMMEIDSTVDATTDPVAFAVTMDSIDYDWGCGHTHGAAVEWAAYKQALARVIAAAPEALSLRYGNPACEMDELVVAMGNAMWRAGVVAGAAYEHLRLAFTTPRLLCADCQGTGCLACGGQGTVQAPPVTIDGLTT